MAWATLFFVWIGLAGCRGAKSSPEGATRAFLEACNREDRPAIEATLTKKSQEVLRDIKTNDVHTQFKSASYVIGTATITEETATVPVRFQDKESKGETLALLRREEGEWRLYGLKFGGEGAWITLDFEHPETIVKDIFGLAGKAIGEGLKEGAKILGEGLKAFGEGMKRAGESSQTPAPK